MFKLREICHPTFILMIVGFFISFMSLSIGISSIDMMLKQLDIIENNGTPIFDVMKNNGVTLSFEIYLFSIVNCLVSTDYWIINKERELSIYKAFGWSNKDLIRLIIKELMIILLICLSLSVLTVITIMKTEYFTVEINMFFIISMLFLLIVTLFISMIIPVYRIFKISPVEAIN
ncbi:MAG: FtsX-like permease family protein [Erysipelotrichaceae bacterium]